MAEKDNRLNAVRALVGSGNIQSQEELIGKLEEAGYSVTQATLSRDLKQLGVAKIYDNHYGYCYRLSTDSTHPATYKEATPSDGIQSIEFCGNMAIIKTMPGFASVVASVIDRIVTLEIAGTIAGDDTVFVAIRENFSRQQVIFALDRCLPGIKNKNSK